MAHKQVGARIEGDVFQGLFFLYQAAGLLIPRSHVTQVDIEHDNATGVDDVAVFYDYPGIDAGGWLCTADFYQIKYHVDKRDAYSSYAIINPGFIRAKSSLLQHFYNAYIKIVSDHPHCRLHLLSNWEWRSDDKLANIFREFDGALPEIFFNSSDGSEIGKIREAWRKHLSLSKENFEIFGKTLRFQLNYFGRRQFREIVYDRLAYAGLCVPDAAHASSSYESLVQQLIMNGPNSLDSKIFGEICRKEGFLDESRVAERIPTLAVRSFVRFTERIEEEVDDFICVAGEFEGRHPRNEKSWVNAVRSIISFFNNPDRCMRLRNEVHALILECHGSLAMLVGYEVSNNTGCQVYPIQKQRRELWKPNPYAKCDGLWATENSIRMGEIHDIAIALSVTHDISGDVLRYLDRPEAPMLGSFYHLKPINGIGPNSVLDADHARQLATELVALMRTVRSIPTACVHLFASAPNSLLFFLGQFREALGRMVLYEYDFGFERHCAYQLSIVLPVQNNYNDMEV